MADSQSVGAVPVLVAEDDTIIRMFVRESLADGGFTVLEAASGSAAIRQFDANATRIQAVVLDIRLGAGPDGWAVARHAREANPKVSVIYTSGHGAAHWPAQGVPNSILLEKPFTPAQIVTAVASQLNQSAGAADGPA
jgi:DNA-binding response OmpR family regulator